METSPPVAPYAEPVTPSPKPRPLWPVYILLPFLVVAYVIQSQILPCACAAGTVKVNAALALDVLVGLRVCAAMLLRERNYHWVVYFALVAYSVFWIPLVFPG